MSIDFRTIKPPSRPSFINGEPIEAVRSYKYLGIVLDADLNWNMWSDCLNKKIQQRMYFLRKLFSFNATKRMLKMFYCAFIESVLTFCIICWFGNASEAQKNSVRKTITLASKLIGIPLQSMESLYKERTITKAGSIVRSDSHPLASFFSLLPSGRRYRTPLLIPNRSGFSFVPRAIKFLNDLG